VGWCGAGRTRRPSQPPPAAGTGRPSWADPENQSAVIAATNPRQESSPKGLARGAVSGKPGRPRRGTSPTRAARSGERRAAPGKDRRAAVPLRDGQAAPEGPVPRCRVEGSGHGDSPVMVLHDPHAFFRRLGASRLIGFGESYQAGEWDSPPNCRGSSRRRSRLYAVLSTSAGHGVRRELDAGCAPQHRASLRPVRRAVRALSRRDGDLLRGAVPGERSRQSRRRVRHAGRRPAPQDRPVARSQRGGPGDSDVGDRQRLGESGVARGGPRRAGHHHHAFGEPACCCSPSRRRRRARLAGRRPSPGLPSCSGKI
jgi:hypothetical protein